MPHVIDERSVYRPQQNEMQLDWEPALRSKVEDARLTPEPISPERMRIAEARILYLSPILQQLYALRNEPEADDYGRLQPTESAFAATIDILIDAAIDAYPRKIPSGCVSTDSAGGVRIEWVRETSSVHLVVPPADDAKSYIYHEVGSNYGTEDATPKGLSHWLKVIPRES